MDFAIIDNSKEIKEAAIEAALSALEECGLVGEGFAKKLCPVDTGNLRNSITHAVDPQERAVYIGTNNEYGPYVELGTGKYYDGGRKTPWVYEDAKGNFHMTHGQRAQPYLKPAVAENGEVFRGIIESRMSNG